jgi:hypothetical protein
MGAKNEQLDQERAGLKGNRPMRGSAAADRRHCKRTCSPLCAYNDHIADGTRQSTPTIGQPRQRQRKPRPRPCNVTQTLQKVLMSPFLSSNIPSPHSVLRNWRVRGCPLSARLGFRPARARPSWIIRGVCPLHDLMEVQMGEEYRRNKT